MLALPLVSRVLRPLLPWLSLWLVVLLAYLPLPERVVLPDVLHRELDVLPVLLLFVLLPELLRFAVVVVRLPLLWSAVAWLLPLLPVLLTVSRLAVTVTAGLLSPRLGPRVW